MNTGPLKEDISFDIVKLIIQSFDIGIVLVIASDRLCINLQKQFPEKPVIQKLEKNGGVEDPGEKFKNLSVTAKFMNYFSVGRKKINVKFDEVAIYKITSKPKKS